MWFLSSQPGLILPATWRATSPAHLHPPPPPCVGHWESSHSRPPHPPPPLVKLSFLRTGGAVPGGRRASSSHPLPPPCLAAVGFPTRAEGQETTARGCAWQGGHVEPAPGLQLRGWPAACVTWKGGGLRRSTRGARSPPSVLCAPQHQRGAEEPLLVGEAGRPPVEEGDVVGRGPVPVECGQGVQPCAVARSPEGVALLPSPH